jgi:hypothetical protein
MLNLLHLLAALAMAGCLYALWREARGISQSRGHLMVAPPLAFGCVLVMISLTEPDLQQPNTLRIAMAAGVLLALLVVMAAAAPLVSTQGQSYVPYATAVVAFGAGFLSPGP